MEAPTTWEGEDLLGDGSPQFDNSGLRGLKTCFVEDESQRPSFGIHRHIGLKKTTINPTIVETAVVQSVVNEAPAKKGAEEVLGSGQVSNRDFDIVNSVFSWHGHLLNLH